MKQKHIIAHMRSIKNYADCSTAVRAKVGCLIVKDDRIISIGYNGTPSGWDNCCETKVYHENIYGVSPDEVQELITKPEVMHAEFNALMKICKSTESSNGSVLFCTYSPCFNCAKMIASAGIVAVYFNKLYKTDDGRGAGFLSDFGVCIEHLSDDFIWTKP